VEEQSEDRQQTLQKEEEDEQEKHWEQKGEEKEEGILDEDVEKELKLEDARLHEVLRELIEEEETEELGGGRGR